jgi:uncharacterized protein YqfB (UPF0267 family)
MPLVRSLYSRLCVFCALAVLASSACAQGTLTDLHAAQDAALQSKMERVVADAGLTVEDRLKLTQGNRLKLTHP